jgi:hypothetical protein
MIDENVLEGLLGVVEEHSDGLGTAVDVEIVQLHIFYFGEMVIYY